METTQTLIGLISSVANVSPVHLQATTNLHHDLAMDSLDFMLLIVKVEQLFDVIFTTQEIAEIETVADAGRCLERHLS